MRERQKEIFLKIVRKIREIPEFISSKHRRCFILVYRKCINYNAVKELFSLVKLPDKTKVAKDVVTCSSKTPVRRPEAFFEVFKLYCTFTGLLQSLH